MRKIIKILLVTAVLLAMTALSVSAIDTSHWAVDYVDFCINNDILDETRASIGASDLITRKELALAITRIEGVTCSNSVNPPFPDVGAGTAYSGAINWVYENGVMNGHSDGYFKPNEPIKRQDIAIAIYKYLVIYREIDLPSDIYDNITVFSDDDQIDTYALSYVEALYDADIITGADNSQFRPQSNVTMTEAACFFTRMHGYAYNGDNTINVYVKTESGAPVLNAAVVFCLEDSTNSHGENTKYVMSNSEGFATLANVEENYYINAMSQYTSDFSEGVVSPSKLYQILTLPTNKADYDLTANYNRANLYPHSSSCKETSWAFPQWCPTALMSEGQNYGWRYVYDVRAHEGIDYYCPVEQLCNTTGQTLRVVAVGDDRTPENQTGDRGIYIQCRIVGTSVDIYFYHLTSYNVSQGDYVPSGGLLGYTGTTGFSFGLHLHTSLRIYSVISDPRIYFK